MKPAIAMLTLALTILTGAVPGTERPQDVSGEVRVPLSTYTALLEQLTGKPRSAPAEHAIGRSDVAVTVNETDGRFTATAEVTVQIETFDAQWALIPILPPGAALRHASIDGRPVQLVERPEGLAWHTDGIGAVSMRLVYDVDARQHDAGHVLALMTPRAAATTFRLSFPGSGMELAVMPSADMKVIENENHTQVSATIPATSTILVSWRSPDRTPFSVGRAHYRGTLQDQTLAWSADYEVEVFTGREVSLPVLPSSAILNDLRVDGEAASVVERDGQFVTRIRGRGQHQVQVVFQVPVNASDGPPRASFRIPRVPVSRFQLELPGRKEITVSPGTAVHSEEMEGATRATVFIPMHDSVAFSWTEAVPEALRGQLRANASLYHQVHADEGVVHARATIVYEVSHGETDRLQLEIPGNAQVNRIVAPAGGVSDWVVVDGEEGQRILRVFLERPVSGQYVLDVFYEQLFDAGSEAGATIDVPLLSAIQVQRQRGMVALLTGQELTLEPVAESGLSRVGENQLPAFVRDGLARAVAHTYKYVEARPALSVAAVAPQRKQGQFDAQVDTLVSLGEVTMKGSATIGVDVKSGTLGELLLQVPPWVNVLGVSAPSLRSHQVRTVDDAQHIELAFTREMEGQFRIEVNYERIMDAQAADVVVPTIAVVGAQVEHGRIAVEALTAVEVRATTVEQLSSLDINELPRQLVLKTTNPILLAYRYAQTRAPSKLSLTITRHQEIDVQVAVIERADYGSLFTSDGLVVTSARLNVRNSRRQFLRLSLPPRSEVWSVFVDGRPEKPAYANDEGSDDDGAVLIKMINSSDGFAVDIVYATRVDEMGSMGTVSSQLPRPDMVVTRTRWDVFLPVGPRYFTPSSSMDRGARGPHPGEPARSLEAVARASDAAHAQAGQPLRISVPTQGVRFSFEELYANQSRQHSTFAVRYVSRDVRWVGLLSSAFGALLVTVGVLSLLGRRRRLPRATGVSIALAGAVTLGTAMGYLGASPVPALAVALSVVAVLAAVSISSRLRQAMGGRT